MYSVISYFQLKQLVILKKEPRMQIEPDEFIVIFGWNDQNLRI